MQADTEKTQPTTDETRSLASDDSGATTLETALLLAAIGIPSFFIIQACLGLLVDHYRMTVTLLALPLP